MSSAGYSIGVTGSTGPAGQIETIQVPKTKIESVLHDLMLAFENSATTRYGVKKARTSVTVTKTAEGQLEFGIGLGPFKLAGAEGALKGEVSQVFEIEIERIDDASKSNTETYSVKRSK
jgi:hypothetical protein